MVWLKSIAFMGIVGSVISPALVSFAALPPQLTVQSYPQGKVSLEFPPTDDRGAPARTGGGGTRGSSCTEESKIPLTALMPKRNNVGTTFAANPAFFVYVPKTTARSAEFVVVDDQGKEVYLTSFTLPNTPGITKVSLPGTASLKTSKDYMWQFALICDPIDRSQDVFIQGGIRRMELGRNLKTKLEKATPLEQAKLYAEAKIWPETLAILAQLRSDLPAEWEELLKSVGLENIAREPFISAAQ